MKRINVFLALAMCGATTFLASCSSDKKTEQPAAAKTTETGLSGEGTMRVGIEPGEAGGVVETTFTTAATISAIDKTTRRITLTSSDGGKATLTAGPNVRNFDQLKVGDKVDATIAERIVVFVRSGTSEPTVTHAAALASAPKGAKPGALVAESYEVTATVKSIDAATRIAVLQFVDGQTKSVKVREDVELSRYKPGDTVVIRVTDALAVLVNK